MKVAGLTDSSSATEAGEARLDYEKEPAASLCSLERVVRPAPTERTNRNTLPTGGGMTGAAAGNDKRARSGDSRRTRWESPLATRQTPEPGAEKTPDVR